MDYIDKSLGHFGKCDGNGRAVAYAILAAVEELKKCREQLEEISEHITLITTTEWNDIEE